MRTRLIHTKIWEDTYFSELSPTEKLVFVYLFTNSRVGMTGVYELPTRVMSFETGVSPKQLEDIKTKFQTDKKVLFHKDYVKVMNFEKYNDYGGSKNESAKEKELTLLPQEIVDVFNSVSIPNEYPIDRVSDTPDTPTIAIAISKARNNITTELIKNHTDEFQEFLQLFNTKFGKKYQETEQRRKKYRLRRKKYTPEQLRMAVENLAGSAFHRGENDSSWVADPDFLLRSDEQIDKFLNMGRAKKPERVADLNDPLVRAAESDIARKGGVRYG